MKKLICMLLALVLCMSFASAEVVQYSERYQAVRLAQQAMAEKYQITAPMYTYFYRQVAVNEDGTWVITWNPTNSDMTYVLGVYTAIVSNGEVDLSWTWDGTEVGVNWSSQAWGAKQLQMCLDVVGTTWSMMPCASAAVNVRDTFVPFYVSFEEDHYFTEDLYLPEGDDAAQPARVWTAAEAEALAREVLAAEYGLSDELVAMMMNQTGEYFEQTAFGWQLDFWLAQNPTYSIWTEMNGAYTVQYDAVHDCVWDVYYDASLSANG